MLNDGFGFPSFTPKFHAEIEMFNNSIMDEATHVNDATTLNADLVLGDDISHVRTTVTFLSEM